MASETPAATAGGATDATPAPKAAGLMVPLLAVFILMPALSFAMTQYVLLPKLRAALPAATGEPGASPAGKPGETKAEGGHPAPAAAKKASSEAKGGEAAAGFEFKDVIVNLSGALGTRYLKASFTVTGSDSRLPELVKNEQKKLLDITINVLSARTLNDLDSPTAKTAIREELIAKFNHVLDAELIEEIYFSEFVIQ